MKAAFLLLALFLAGCASAPPPRPPATIEEVCPDDEECPPATDQEVREFFQRWQ